MISMEKYLSPMSKIRRNHKDSSLTKPEMEAVLQLIQLSRTDRKVNEKEDKEGDSTADVSPSTLQRKRKFESTVNEFAGQRRKIQKHSNTKQTETKAAQWLLGLQDKSDGHEDFKKVEEEEEENNSDVSYVTNASSELETQNADKLVKKLNRYTQERKEEEEESKSGTSDLSIMEEWKAFCKRKRKFRSVADIYKMAENLKKKDVMVNS